MTEPSILDGAHRVLTLGAILSFTAIAFEGLAVTTIAPAIAAELRGLPLYGWIFSAYLLAQIVGAIVAGGWVDRLGPGGPAAASAAIFGAGLVLAALAPAMPLLIAARALQGLGAGMLGNCVYTTITLRYDDRLRPSMLATVSSAYIVPSMVGPFLAGLIAERLGWRVVFWLLVPILALSTALMLPAFRGAGGGGASPAARSRLPLAALLAGGTGLLLGGLGRLPALSGVGLALAGAALALPALARLMPGGTFLARPGLPAAVATRGLFVAGFFTADTYVVLGLTDLHHYQASVAGLIIAVGSLTWTACAWVQARLDRRDGGRGRAARIQLGVALLLVAVVAMTGLAWTGRGVALALALGGHLLAGVGIGLAHPAAGAFAFARAPEDAAGEVSAAVQLADAFTPAVAIGLGGALIAIGGPLGWPAAPTIGTAIGLTIPLLALGLLAALRLHPTRP